MVQVAIFEIELKKRVYHKLGQNVICLPEPLFFFSKDGL